jgi:vacuolar-type H+-ATPase subunit H
MTKEIICDIVAAEDKACEIIEKAQADAREASLASQEELKARREKEISAAKEQAKQMLSQKKEALKNEEASKILSNKKEYDQLKREAALHMDKAADFIAERILS